MSRRFEDPSLQGMRVLEVWAGEDEDRRFEIAWSGPRRTDGTGGYRVTVRNIKDVGSRRACYGRTLLEAAEEATKAAE